MITLATVSPCYNEEDALPDSAQHLILLFDALIAQGKISPDSLIVFVNDGSSDRTWDIITRLHKQNSRIRGINLARNTGHQNAIMAGMMTARHWADAVITIDADLQDDYACCIPQMIDDFVSGSDIVYGVKVSRTADPLLKRMSAQVFYRLQESMGMKTIFNHADFRLMSRRALDILSEYKESNLYLRGLVPQIGLSYSTVNDVICERKAGHSKYTLKKMLRLALDGITSFSVRPIYYVVWIGVLFLLISMGIGIYVLHALIAGTAVPGWSSLILSIWLVGGMLMVSIGVVGIYIGKIFIEVKHRPLYHISEIL
jgi:glycosyltransferase involved in cell wall biosynthesis